MSAKHKLFLLAAFMDENDISIHVDAFTDAFPDVYIMVGESESIQIGRDMEEPRQFTAADIIEHAKAME